MLSAATPSAYPTYSTAGNLEVYRWLWFAAAAVGGN